MPSSDSWRSPTACDSHTRPPATAATARPGSELGAAVEESLRALEELRTLAHGIYPAVLTESGLGPALADLADTAAVPVSIEVTVQGRVPRPVERTAYVVVTEAVHDAVERGATRGGVSVGREDRIRS